ncbi:MAG: beta-ribofuranosylaminobenzene 5'-phosphate synthase [Archaeoglobaceae archaeon]
MRVKIKTPSRIHIALIDLNGEIGRVDGGVGIAIEEPYIEIRGYESEENSLSGNIVNLDRFKSVSDKFKHLTDSKASIEVLSDYRGHVGMGSGTQISLAIGEVYNRLFDLGLSVREIAEITGRGGTSGIGVAAFEKGGFIVDGGHSTKEKAGFTPSSASKASPPPVISRQDFPSWRIVAVTPDLTGSSGADEVSLFERHCPVPVEDVRKISHLILMKMIPSVMESNLDDFGDSLWNIQGLGFKKAEIDQYGSVIWDALKELRELTPAVGMSSTGPTIYAITDSDGNATGIQKVAVSYFQDKGLDCEKIITTARNKGADIDVEGEVVE